MKSLLFTCTWIVLCIPYPAFSQLHVIKEDSEIIALRSKILPNYWMDRDSFHHMVDSILNADVHNLDKIVEVCYPVKYDSLYDGTVEHLLNELKAEPDHDRQIVLANKIIDYGPDALSSIQRFRVENDRKMAYWIELLRISLLGTSTYYFIRDNNYDDFDLFRKPLNGINYFQAADRAEGELGQWIAQNKHDSMTLVYFRDFVVRTLLTGKPVPDLKGRIGSMITATLKAKSNELIAPFGQFIREEDMKQTLWILYYIGAERDNQFFPDLLLQALKHPNLEIASKALDWTPNIWDENKKELVHAAVTDIYNGSNEQMKLRAAYILLEDFEERKAFDYVLYQARYGDLLTRRAALYHVKNPCPWGNAITDEVYDVLQYNLSDPDKEVKAAAIQAMLRYKGDKVITAIIPFLTHYYGYVRKDINTMLTKYENRAFVIEQLKAHLAVTEDQNLKAEIEAVLINLSN